MGTNHVAVTWTSDIAPISSKEFLDIQGIKECRLNLKRVRDMIITYSHYLYIWMSPQLLNSSFTRFCYLYFSLNHSLQTSLTYYVYMNINSLCIAKIAYLEANYLFIYRALGITRNWLLMYRVTNLLIKNINLQVLPWNYNTNRNDLKNIPCYMHGLACRWCIVEKTKIFWSMLKFSKIYRR